MNYSPIHLTTVKGQTSSPVIIRWESVAYLEGHPENATRKGCFIYFIGGGSLWVTETPEEILTFVVEA